MVTKNNKGKTVQGGKNRGDKTPAVVTPSVSGGAAAAKADAATPKKPFNPVAAIASIPRFFKEVRIEGGRITWPSRKETWITTVMVLIMVFLACLFFSLTDAIFSFALEQLVRLTLG
jgi:preprotein translocase subunit SecE